MSWVGWRRVVMGVWVCRREVFLLLDVVDCRRVLLLYSSSDQDGLKEQGLAQARKIQTQVHNNGRGTDLSRNGWSSNTVTRSPSPNPRGCRSNQMIMLLSRGWPTISELNKISIRTKRKPNRNATMQECINSKLATSSKLST